MENILTHCHSLECGDISKEIEQPARVLQSGFYLPSLFKDAHAFVSTCDRCQRMGNISRRDEGPLKAWKLNYLTFGG